MAKKSKRQDYYLSSSSAAAAAVVDRIDEDVLAEILVRLPSVSVLRCRAVCKRWRRLTSERSFLVAHAARQPRQLILVHSLWEETTAFPLSDLLRCEPHAQDDVVEPAATASRRRALWDLTQPHSLQLHYSLDGLVVLSAPGWLRARVHIVYNPATRQWTNLPRLTQCTSSSVVTCGFYLHGPSAEYRLLCWGVEGLESWEESDLEQEDPYPDSDSDSRAWKKKKGPASPSIGYYYVLAAGGGALQPRRLESTSWVWSSCYENPVFFGGVLHWFAEHPLGDGATGKMLAFHTVSETFRLMSRPPLALEQQQQERDGSMVLFEANGELGVAAVPAPAPTPQQQQPLDIWVLEDYEAERWALRHRVVVPPPWDHGGGVLTAGVVLPVPVPASVAAAAGTTGRTGGALLILFGGVASVYILHVVGFGGQYIRPRGEDDDRVAVVSCKCSAASPTSSISFAAALARSLADDLSRMGALVAEPAAAQDEEAAAVPAAACSSPPCTRSNQEQGAGDHVQAKEEDELVTDDEDDEEDERADRPSMEGHGA